jgi:tetratricopeptide (TPR) repeat protein
MGKLFVSYSPSVLKKNKKDMNYSFRKIISIVIVCCLTFVHVNAQSNDLLDKANKYYELNDYKQAIVNYVKVLQKNPNEGSAYGKLANSYRFTNDLNNAGNWYIKAVQQPGADPEYFFQYGLVLKMLGKYSLAKAYFTEYAKINPEKGQIFAQSCDFVATRQGDEPLYSVTKEAISSAAADYAPVIYNGNVIYASARTDMKNGMNDKDDRWKKGGLNQLFIARPNADGVLGKPTILKTSFKAKTNEAPVTFTADGKRVAYMTNEFVDGVRNIPETNSRMRIYIADVIADDEWKKPQPFAHNNPEDYNTGYPYFSPDGSALYFASDMPGGYGGMDIYVCYKIGDSWSAPQNLGDKINTAGDEISPFITENSLYFSSNYLPGFGGMDIFRAEQVTGSWSTVLHLGTGINTAYDDYGLVFDNARGYGYMSSNRLGNDDIYRVKVTSERIEIVVLNDRNQPIQGAKIDFTSCGETAVVTDGNGRFKFIANSGLDCRSVKVSKDGYEAKVIRVTASNKDLRLIEVRLNRSANLVGMHIGTVISGDTKSLVQGVRVKITNMMNKTTTETYTDGNGRYATNLDPQSTYLLNYSKDGYLLTSRTILTGGVEDKTILGTQVLEVDENAVVMNGRDGSEEYNIIVVGEGRGVEYPPGGANSNMNLPKIAYDVQFGVFSDPDKDKFNPLRAFGFIYSQRRAGMLKAYKIGAFRTKEEAEKVKTELRLMGYEGAFVTTLTNQRLMSKVLIDKDNTGTTNNNTEPIAARPPGRGGLTPPRPTKPAPTSRQAVYKIQLGAYNNPAFFDKSMVAGLGELSYLELGNGLTLILLGEYTSYKDVKDAEEKVKARGIGAMVVAIQEGKKVPLSSVMQ